MTFLEFVAIKLMGPPAWCNADGSAYWHCPNHSPDNNPSFHTLPPVAGKKDRFRCFPCNFRGDVYDLVSHFHPAEKFPTSPRVAAYRVEYERLKLADTPVEPQRYTPRGTGPSEQATVDPMEADTAHFAFVEDLKEWETSEALALQIVKQLRQRSKEYNATMEAVLAAWERCYEWITGHEIEHVANCKDEECEWAVCRRARGLPPVQPLTAEEREARARKKMEKARARLHKHPVRGDRKR